MGIFAPEVRETTTRNGLAVHAENPEQLLAAFQARRHYVATEPHREALARLREGLGTRETFLLVTGDPGTGKTELVHQAIAAWGSRAAVAFIANPSLTGTELVEEIVRRFGAEPPSGVTKPQLLASLERVLAEVAERGQVAVLVVDDAHALASEQLDELRLLANAETQNHRRFEIVLVGLPPLETRLSEPAFASLRQRVAVHCQLSALSHKSTRRYINERVGAVGGDSALFPRETCREIYAQTGGVPRAINTLATQAMRRARAAKSKVVTPDHVRAAVAGLLGEAPAGERPAPAPSERKKNSVEAKVKERPAPAPAGGKTNTVAATAEDSGAVAEAGAASAPADAPRGPLNETQQEWVARFIGDQGPPRIGALCVRHDEVEFGDEVVPGSVRIVHADGAADEHADVPALAAMANGSDTPAEAARLPRDRRTPRVQERPMHYRPPRGGTSWLFAAAVLGIALAAIFVVQRARQRDGVQGATKVALRGDTGGAEASAVANRAPGFAISDVEPSASASATVVLTVRGHAAAPTVPESRHAVAPVGAAVVAAPPTVSAPAAAPPQRLTPVSGSADSTAASERLTLEVATYIDKERAAAERDRLVAESGLHGWVATRFEGGVEAYRIMLGVFRTSDRAEAAATKLMSRRLVSQARVVPLPPKRSRR